MHAIIVGIGRMLSACLLAYFSSELPRWLGVTYSSQKHVEHYKQIVVREEIVEDNNDGDDDAEKSDPDDDNDSIATDDDLKKMTELCGGKDGNGGGGNGNKSTKHNRAKSKKKTRIVVIGMKELTFRVGWAILGHFFVMYPFLLMYFCNVKLLNTVLSSTLIGVLFGFSLVYFLWLSHTRLGYHHRSVLSIFLSLVIALASSVAFSAGCWYVKEVWHNNKSYTNEYAALTFLTWLILIGGIHWAHYKLTQRKLVQTAIANGQVVMGGGVGIGGFDNDESGTNHMDLSSRHGRRNSFIRRNYVHDDVDSICYTVGARGGGGVQYSCYRNRCSGTDSAGGDGNEDNSENLNGSRHGRRRIGSYDGSVDMQLNRDDVKKIKGEWRYGQSDVFQPPKSVHCVRKELSQAVSPKFKTRFSTFLKKNRAKKSDIGGEEHEEEEKEEVAVDADLRRTNLNFDNYAEDIGKATDAPVVDSSEEDTFVNRSIMNRSRKDSRDGTLQTFTTVESCTNNGEEDNDEAEAARTVAAANNIDDSEFKEYIVNDNDVVGGTVKGDEIQNDIINVPSDVEIIIHHNEDENRKNPTLWQLMKVNSCCRRRKHYNLPRRTGCDRFGMILKWFLWATAASMHVFFTILTIGATIQQNTVREALNPTFELLYPSNYNTGPMCAYAKNTTNDTVLRDNDYFEPDIRTFDSLQDVHDANYTVLHCGECGACSNWNDLSLQWTTRTHLAELASKCGKEILFGGTIEDVHECNHNEIGFTDECAMCWTVDEMCCKNNCFFIFLQSVFTNSLGNFEVDENAEITTAACDEALCGPEFVPCSGATRRRMNIVSDIARPKSQQCNVATEDWSVVFDHP